MRIRVTDHHILRGKPKCSGDCPIGLVIGERVSPWWIVAITPYYANFYAINARVEAPLPESARDFVRRFDKSEPVEPFEFELPEPWGIL